MADLLKMSRSAYGKLERGETRIDIERLKEIAEAFEIDVIDFLEDETVVVTHHGDSSRSSNGVVIQPSYNASDEVWQRMVTHLEEEVLGLRRDKEALHQDKEALHKDKEQLMKLLEKFTT